MIEKRQAKNWEFIFLGANMDAVSEAGRMGIKASRTANFVCDSIGTALNYQVLNETVRGMRSAESAEAMSAMLDNEECLSPISEDYEKRKA